MPTAIYIIIKSEPHAAGHSQGSVLEWMAPVAGLG